MIRYIHYSGMLKHAGLIDPVCEETLDICESHRWHSGRIDISRRQRIRGVEFEPPGCQPVYLTFLTHGELSSPIRFMYPDIFGQDENLYQGRRWIYVQTQEATLEIHTAVVQLMEYLKSVYFKRFDIRDEIRYGIGEVDGLSLLLPGLPDDFSDPFTWDDFPMHELPDEGMEWRKKIRRLLSKKNRKRR